MKSNLKKKNLAKQASFLVVFNLVEPQAEAQGIRHPLVLILLAPPPVDVAHVAGRWQTEAFPEDFGERVA